MAWGESWSAMDAYSLHELNIFRMGEGVQPLAFDQDVWEAAQAHSKNVINTDVFEHSNPVQDVSNAGFKWRPGGYGWFQNHSWEANQVPGGPFTWTTAQMQAVADLFLEGYKASPPHLANLLNPEHELAGISNIQGNFAGFAGAWMNTQDMGWNARNPFVLGFVYNDNDGDGTYDMGDGAASTVVRLSYHGGGVRASTLTDVNGYFAFEIGPGTYDLRIGSSVIPVTVGADNVMVDIITNAVPANMNNTWQHFGRPVGQSYNSWYHV